MQAQPSRILPVEFITIAYTSQHSDTFDRDDDCSVISTELFIVGDASKYCTLSDEQRDVDLVSFEESSLPPWPLIGAKEIAISAFQPSLSRTFDSDSSSLLSDTASNSEPVPRSSSDSNPTHITSSVPTFTFTSKYLRRCSFSSELLMRSKHEPYILSCESTAVISTVTSSMLSSASQPSGRIKESKNRSRSIELQHCHHKCTSSKSSMGQFTKIIVSYDPDNASVCSKLSLPHRNQIYEAVSIIQSMVETMSKIICINTMLFMVYLLFVFYKYSLSIAMQGFTPLFSDLHTSIQGGAILFRALYDLCT